MNVLQTGLLGMLGNVTAQLLASVDAFNWQPVVEQGVLGAFVIAPVVSAWIPVLCSLKLHWVGATVVDQFLFSPIFNLFICKDLVIIHFNRPFINFC